MELARRLMRLVGCGVTLQALAAQMAGSHRGFLTILGHTRLVLDKGRRWDWLEKWWHVIVIHAYNSIKKAFLTIKQQNMF
jgi:hypothetical protein